MIQLFATQPLKVVDSEFEHSLDRLKQIDGVVREILTISISYEPERLRAMIIILSHIVYKNSRLRFAIWRLRQDLMSIAAVDSHYEAKDNLVLKNDRNSRI